MRSILLTKELEACLRANIRRSKIRDLEISSFFHSRAEVVLKLIDVVSLRKESFLFFQLGHKGLEEISADLLLVSCIKGLFLLLTQ